MQEKPTIKHNFNDLLIQNSTDGILAMDRGFLYTVWNPAMEAMTGLSKEFCLGKNAFEVFPFLVDVGADEYIKRAMEGETTSVKNLPFTIPHTNKRGLFEAKYSPLKDENGDIVGVMAVVRDTTESEEIQKQTQKNNRLLSAIAEAQSGVIFNDAPEAIFDRLLFHVLKLTESRYGFITEAFHNAEGSLHLQTKAITNIPWDDSVRKLYAEHEFRGMIFTELDNLFGLAATSLQPVISNDTKNDPRGKGLPHGHPPLDNFLGIPLLFHEKLMGVVGLANREGGYVEEMQEFLVPFLNTCAHILKSHKDKQEKSVIQKKLLMMKEAVESAPTGIIITDHQQEDMPIVYVNKGFTELTGYEMDEIMGENCRFLQNDDRQQEGIQVIREALKQKTSCKVTLRNYRKDGSLFFNELYLSPVIDEQGEVMHFVGIQNDITERVMLEGELAQREEKYRLLADNIRDVIWNMDIHGRFLYMSPSIKSLRGISAEEALKKPFTDSLAPESLPQVMEVLQAKIEEIKKGVVNRESVVLEVQQFHADGHLIDTEIKANAVFDQNDNFQFFVGVTRDITDRKKTERQVEENDRKYRLLAENSLDVISIFDAQLNYTYISQSVEKLLGYQPEEMMPYNFKKFITEKSFERMMQVHKSRKSAKQTFTTELEFIRKDGSIIWGENQSSALTDDEGNITGYLAITRDIHDRKMTQKALEESEEKFRLLINSTDDIVFTLDRDQRHTGVYGDWVYKLGLKPEHFIGKTPTEIMGHAGTVHEEANRKALEGNSISYQWSIPSANGTLYYQTALSPIRNEQQEVVGLIGVGRNITEIKQAEAKIKESEEAYRLLYDANPNPMLIYNKENYKILSVNQRALQHYGYSLEEFTSMTAIDMRPDHEKDKFKQHIQPQQIDYKHYQSWHHQKKNGEIFPVEIYTNDITFLGQESRLVLIVDVTENRATRVALEKSEANLKNVLSALNEAVWSMDYPSMETVYISPSAHNFFGDDLENFFQDPNRWLSIIHPADRSAFKNSHRSLLEEGQTEVLYRLSQSNGGYKWISERKKIIYDEAREPVQIEGIAIDITNLQEAREKLEERNRELNNFVYSVSHDLRGPLSSIEGLTNLIKNENIDTNIQSYIEMIDERLKRLHLFISDVVSHSKNLNLPVLVQPIDFEGIIAELFVELEDLPNAAMVEKKTQVSKGFNFHSDIERVKNIMKILLTNAIEYTNEDLDEHWVFAEVETSKGQAIIKIIDNGCGIKPDMYQRVWDMFYRGDTRSKGAGIGLYIAARKVEKLQGSIDFKSSKEGTTFKVLLPDLRLTGQNS